MTNAADKSRMLTLVFTDLADSTALKTARGDVAVGDLISRHRDHVRQLAGDCTGRIIDWAGDCEGERLRIVVRDDGPGLDGKALNEGVGLANTRERLEQIHGDRASLQVRSPDGGGVEAELWIPLRPA